RLARHIGLGNAKKIIYSCSNIKAPEALTLGLVQGVYPQAELMENALKLANKIAKNAPIAVRACKEAINVGMQVDIDSAVKYEANIFGRCFGVDQKEAMTAFVEKRDHAPFVNK
ncbi:MAG: enoyl-CoA hydratase-related protein, partial [Bacillota bacterium]|nr:enoyl-CoA hydratase-related protein [Bacillota bacterium]